MKVIRGKRNFTANC